MNKVIKAGTYEMSSNKGEVRDLKAYKMAKIVCADMSKIIPRINACLVFLKPYENYNQVGEIIYTMQKKLEILEQQHKKYQKLLLSKGKINESP